MATKARAAAAKNSGSGHHDNDVGGEVAGGGDINVVVGFGNNSGYISVGVSDNNGVANGLVIEVRVLSGVVILEAESEEGVDFRYNSGQVMLSSRSSVSVAMSFIS